MRRPLRALACAALAALVGCDAPDPPAEREVRVRVDTVAVDRFDAPVVILAEQDGPRRLPIWIGVAEAGSIAAHLQQAPPPRPNFHDFAQRVIESVRAEVERVVVTEIRDGTYYATLWLRTNGRVVEIDARPSDAIAVALRMGAPIWVRESLFEAVQQGLPGGDSGESVSFETPRSAHPGGSAQATPGLKL